jgi:hypothetical protein
MFCASAAVWAGGVPTADLGEIEVTAVRATLLGSPQSATDGIVLRQQLEHRPVLRTGELLEAVPGLIVTQHSGNGKANQFFLRGFNLDHGTDFATRVDGVPVNLPTHAHGQGYTDVNFVIPELIGSIAYHKGTHHAGEGNFSAAGAAHIRYANSLGGNLLSFTGGEDDYRRVVLAGSPQLAGATVLYGLEYMQTDGPWALPEDLERKNAVLRYARGDQRDGWAVTAMVYEGEWQSSDQVPLRAITSGAIDRFGFIDPTGGGESSRYSLSARWEHAGDRGRWSALAYGVDYDLELFSNFTYFTDPVDGDQFEQLDDRRVYGGTASYQRDLAIGGFAGEFSSGLEFRYDDIGTVGLYRTRARERFDTIREDQVRQRSCSAYASQRIDWSQRLRSTLAMRVDHFEFDVDSDLDLNSGGAAESIVSPKLSLVFALSERSDFYLNLGGGFHSNDARGTTIRVDPDDGVTPAERVDPLVRALGGELGLRHAIADGWQVSAAVWGLELESELLFVGDGGTTESHRASRRRGAELAFFARPMKHLVLDADFAWSHASFTEFDASGDYIPGAVERVASLGVTLDHPAGWFAGARLRYLGSATLIENNSMRSDPTTLLNLETGYDFTATLSVTLSVLNALDSDDNDISYYYDSQLANENAPIADVHLHPAEPRTVRLGLRARF